MNDNRGSYEVLYEALGVKQPKPTPICPLLTIAGGPRYDGSREMACIGEHCAFWHNGISRCALWIIAEAAAVQLEVVK